MLGHRVVWNVCTRGFVVVVIAISSEGSGKGYKETKEAGK